MKSKEREEFLKLAQIYYQALRIAAVLFLKISSPSISLEDDDYEAMEEFQNFVEQIDPEILKIPPK